MTAHTIPKTTTSACLGKHEIPDGVWQIAFFTVTPPPWMIIYGNADRKKRTVFIYSFIYLQ